MWRADSSALAHLFSQHPIKQSEDETKKLLFSSGSSCLEEISSPDAACSKKQRHNIASSKEILEAAVTLPSMGGLSGPGPGGALGSLLSLLLSTRTLGHRMECFATLSFLLTDKGNRRTFLDLEASSVILQVMSEIDPSGGPENIDLLLLALRTLVNLVGKQDACSESEKFLIWRGFKAEDHPLMTILSASHLLSRPQLSEVLTLLRQLAFSESHSLDGSRFYVLIQPQLLLGIENLLHPSTDSEVLLRAMNIVKAASTGALCDDLALWTRLLFRLVPLLVGRILHSSSSSLIEMALSTLLNLAERSKKFREAITGAGFIVPLLSLNANVHRPSIRTSASLILAAVAESSSLARTQLSRAVPIRCILNALSLAEDSTIQEQDANIGLLVCLSQLASSNPLVLTLIRQLAGVPKLERLAEEDNCDVAEEAESLLDLLAQGKQMLRGSTMDWRSSPTHFSDANITITLHPTLHPNGCTN